VDRSHFPTPTPVPIEVAHSLLGGRKTRSEYSTLAEAFAVVLSCPPSAQQFGKFFPAAATIRLPSASTPSGSCRDANHCRHAPRYVPQHAAQNFPGQRFGKQRVFILIQNHLDGEVTVRSKHILGDRPSQLRVARHQEVLFMPHKPAAGHPTRALSDD
jgi:hypothetical protein